MRIKILIFIATATAAGSGCGADDGGASGDSLVDASPPDTAAPDAPVSPSAFSFVGKVDPALPADAVIVVAWPVFLASPDYLYKYGEGHRTGPTLTTGVPGVLPEAARNAGFGVGLVVEFPAGTVIPDGVVNESGTAAPLGSSLRQGIVYRAEGVTDPAWLTAFPVGYSCGQCVDRGPEMDSFRPIACSEVTLNHAVNGGCNYF